MIRYFLTVVLACSLAACGSNRNKDDASEPAELQDFEERVELIEVWSRKVGNGQGKDNDRLSLSVSAKGVCGASVNGRVICFDHDGQIQWQERVADRLSAGVGESENQVLATDSDGNLLVLARENGELLWRKNFSSQVLAAPQSDDETVMVQTTDGRLLSLDAESGEKRWEYIADEPRLTLKGTATPVIADGSVYTGFANGKLVALELENGALQFDSPVAIASGTSEIERLVDIDSSPLLLNQSIYAVSYNGNLFAFDRANGRPQWRYETSSYRELSTGLNKIYLVDDSSRVFALDKNSGNERWLQAGLRNRRLGASYVFAGYLIVADYKGYLHVLSQVDGSIVGRERAGGIVERNKFSEAVGRKRTGKVAGRTRGDRSAINVPLRHYADKLYVYSDNGKLTAYRLNVIN